MRQIALAGAVFVFLSTSPAWASYVSPSNIIPQSCTSTINAWAAVDGDLDTYGVFYGTGTGGTFYAVFEVPHVANVNAIRLDYYTPSGVSVWGSRYYCDGSSFDHKTTTDIVTGSTYTWVRSIEPGCVLNSFDLIFYKNPSAYYNMFNVGYLLATQSPYTTEVTSSVIADLLSNATFQTTISSIAAASDIADWLTFAPNETGGKAAWLFGCFLALMFIFGIRVGLRS